jgi:hypothetical protein
LSQSLTPLKPGDQCLDLGRVSRIGIQVILHRRWLRFYARAPHGGETDLSVFEIVTLLCRRETMFKLICHSLYAVFIAVVLGVLAAPGTVGLSQPAQDPKKQSKQEREYQKIKQFSEKLYAEDTVFREEIENLYYQKQKEHSEYAYFTNTLDSHDEQITRNGDKLKVDDTLYDNPLVQDYVNRVGQSIVPKDSKWT